MPHEPIKNALLSLIKRLRRQSWKQTELISRDGQRIYTVRDRDGHERQVLTPQGKWKPVSTVKFSLVECYEDYHRERFETAIPRKTR